MAALAGVGVAGIAARSRAPEDRFVDPRELYFALANQPGEDLGFGSGTIRLVFADGTPGIDRDQVRAWVRLAARAMIAYFGQFPIRRYGLLVIAEDGRQVGHATTFGFAGSATRIHVGRDAGPAAFGDDWVLVHEMMHAALPDLPRRALWLQEGNATWLEPIARARAGAIAPADVWRQAIRGMPRGLPDTDESGMDGTDRWGRLYWGGATFWLEAEIALFRQSRGRFGLADAMRAVSAQSGGNIVTWTPERLMAVGDQACGTSALSALYERYANYRVAPDLPSLFTRLGVTLDADGKVMVDPHAELADLTRKLTAMSG